MRLTETVTPLKPLEAMAQGRLLIASDVGGHRELIERRRHRATCSARTIRRHWRKPCGRCSRIAAGGTTMRGGRPALRRAASATGAPASARYAAVYDAAPGSGRAAMTPPLRSCCWSGRCRRLRAAWPTRRGSSRDCWQAEGMSRRAGADQRAVPPGVGRQRCAACAPRSGSCRTCCDLSGGGPGRRGARHGELRLGVAPVRRAGDPHRAAGAACRWSSTTAAGWQRSSWPSRRASRPARHAPRGSARGADRVSCRRSSHGTACRRTIIPNVVDVTMFRPAEPQPRDGRDRAAPRRHAQSRATSTAMTSRSGRLRSVAAAIPEAHVCRSRAPDRSATHLRARSRPSSV